MPGNHIQEHLQFKIVNGDKRGVKRRLKTHPHEINEVNDDNQNAAHLAALHCPEILELLIKKNVDLATPDINGKTPLMLLTDPRPSTKIINELYQSTFQKNEIESTGVKATFKRNLTRNHWSEKRLIHSKEILNPPAKLKFQKPNSVGRSLTKLKKREGILPQEESEIEASALDELIKSDSLRNFRQYLKQYSLNHQLLLKKAYQVRAVKTFVWLLKNGATLQYDTNSLPLYQQWQQNFTSEDADFLLKVSERIQKSIKAQQVITAKKEDELVVKKAEFQRRLIEHGLSVKFKRNLADEETHEEDLEQVLYKLCTGYDEGETDLGTFDSEKVQQRVLGLLNFYSATQITTALSAVNLKLPHQGKVVALYVLMTMLLNDSISKCYADNHYLETTLKEFLGSDSPFYAQLLQLAALKKATDNPLIKAESHITVILMRWQSVFEINVVDLGPNNFAHACCALTRQVYHLLEISEFQDQSWRKELKYQKSPNLVYANELFDKLKDLLVQKILIQPDLKAKVKTIEFLIQTLANLMKRKTQDLNSAMAIAMALMSIPIARLQDVFNAIHPKLKKRWEELQPNFFVIRNFALQRDIMAQNPSALPFIGIYLKDYDASCENTLWNKSLFVGKLNFDILARKNIIADFPLDIRCDLFPYLHQWSAEENIEADPAPLFEDNSVDPLVYRFNQLKVSSSSPNVSEAESVELTEQKKDKRLSSSMSY